MPDRVNIVNVSKYIGPLFMIKKTRLSQGPLLLDGLLGAKMTSMLKIKNFSKSSYGVNVKVHINHQKKVL